MRRFVRENSLSLFFLVIFLLALVGQAFAGVADYNAQLLANGREPVSLAHFVLSAEYAADVTENWQSEYLQFLLYLWATVWFVQRGSSESKQVGETGTGSDEQQKVPPYADARSPLLARAGGLRTALYSRSLGLLMGVVFLLSWLAQAVSGWAAYNEDQLIEQEDPVSWLSYLGRPDFWNRSLQNWQSEFLAVGSMAVFSVYLRQRGSPESKPVGEAHEATGVSG